LPFAGHPTLGTALYLHESNSAVDEITLDLKVGKIPVRFSGDARDTSRPRVDGRVFGEMRQRDPEFGLVLPSEKVARVIGVDVGDIASVGPCQVVSTGLPFAIIPIRDSQTLMRLKNSSARAATFLEGTGARFFYFLCLEPREGPLAACARMFFYGGEDPATGSAAGCAASWLVKYGLAKPHEQVVIHQGGEAGRPSEIFVQAKCEEGRVTDVRVGGYAIEVLRGAVTL